MTPVQRLHLCLKLKEAQAHIAELFEGLACDVEPKAMIYDADRAHTKIAEVLAAIMTLARQPGEMQLVGGAVTLGDLVVVDDAKAQVDMAAAQNARADELEADRADGGITGLLDDTEPAHSSERDNRLVAAE